MRISLDCNAHSTSGTAATAEKFVLYLSILICCWLLLLLSVILHNSFPSPKLSQLTVAVERSQSVQMNGWIGTKWGDRSHFAERRVTFAAPSLREVAVQPKFDLSINIIVSSVIYLKDIKKGVKLQRSARQRVQTLNSIINCAVCGVNSRNTARNTHHNFYYLTIYKFPFFPSFFYFVCGLSAPVFEVPFWLSQHLLSIATSSDIK